MVPAGPAGSTGTVSAARDMMVLRRQSAKGSNALAAFPEIVEDMLDLHEWVVERCAIVVKSVGADVAHEFGQ